MVDGCEIRELPDGGREFVLDEPALTFIRIDHQSSLRFGRTEVVIRSPFVLEMGGSVHHLDPQRWDALGPLVALFPGSLRWLWTSPRGDLTAVFQKGATLTVSSDPMGTAWSVGDIYSVSGRPGTRPPAA